MKIFLTGFMGAGKSDLGADLAKELGYRFIDTDEAIEKEAGKSIAKIFEEQGEEAFRQMETDLLRQLAASADNMVVATGGGMPVHSGNHDLMLQSGLVIYLKRFEQDLVERLEDNRENRPLLNGIEDEDLPRYVNEKLRERVPVYSQAHVVVDAKDITAGIVKEYLETTGAQT